MKTTIQTIQQNTQQVKKGYWSVTLPGSTKVVANVVKLQSGEYGVTNDMSAHRSFMAALGHILPIFKKALPAASSAVRKAVSVALFGVMAVSGVAHATAHVDDLNSVVTTANTNEKNIADIVTTQNEINAATTDTFKAVNTRVDNNNRAIVNERTQRVIADANQTKALSGEATARLESDRELAKRIATNKSTGEQNHTDIERVASVNDSQDHALDNHEERIKANTATSQDAAKTAMAASNQAQVNSGQILSQSRAVASQGQQIDQNTRDISKNTKDIAENRKNIKRVGSMAQAIAGLHYNRSESGAAVALGEYDGSTAIAGGVQFNTSANSAATVGVSWDGNAVGANVGWHTSF